MCWAGGNLLGGLSIMAMGALRDGGGGGGGGARPAGNMFRALVLQAVGAAAAVPLALCLEVRRLGLARGAAGREGG